MKSYQFWTEQALRWGACVDFSSVMSAWSREMLDEAIKARAEGRAPSMANVKPGSKN